LAHGWDRLAEHATLPTQARGFAAALATTYLADQTVEVFVARDQGIQALIRCAMMAGGGPVGGWWARAKCMNRAMCWPLIGRWLIPWPARWCAMAARWRWTGAGGLALIPALRRAMRGRGWVAVRPAMPCPTVPLGPAWVTPEEQFNAGRRSDFRRAPGGRRRWGRCFMK
jgi:hypothetical protein